MPLFDFPMKKNSIWTQNVVIKLGYRLFKSIRTYSNRPIYWERIPLDHENPLNCRWQMITNSKKIFQNFSVWNILANARHWDSEWTLPSVFMYTFSRVLKIEKIRKLPNTWFRPENSIIATSLTFWKTRMKISISCSQYMKMLILAFDVVLHSITNSQPFLIIRFFFLPF